MNKYNQLKKLYKNPYAVKKFKRMLARLVLSHITKKLNLDKLVKEFSDIEIYAILHNLYKAEYGEEKMKKNLKNSLLKGSQNRYTFVKHIIQKHYNKPNINILDVGTEDCSFMYLLKKQGKSYAINVETEDFSSYITDKSCVKSYDGINIPHKDNSIDIIISTMVIHHMNDAVTTLKDVHRVLKPEGLLIIKEHDSDNEYTEIIIDAVHFIYELVLGPTFNYKYYSDYNITRYTKKDVTKMLTNIGFENIPNYVPEHYRGIRGAARGYYNVFMK